MLSLLYSPLSLTRQLALIIPGLPQKQQLAASAILSAIIALIRYAFLR